MECIMTKWKITEDRLIRLPLQISYEVTQGKEQHILAQHVTTKQT